MISLNVNSRRWIQVSSATQPSDPKRQRRRVKLSESEPEAVATGQGVNFTSREFESLNAVTQVLTTTVESLAARYHHPSRAAGFPGPLPVLIRINANVGRLLLCRVPIMVTSPPAVAVPN
jgi:hypothetical protein